MTTSPVSDTLAAFIDSIDQVKAELLDGVKKAADTKALNDLRVDGLGKKGKLTALLRGMGGLDGKDRKPAGQAVNAAKDEVAAELEKQLAKLKAAEQSARLEQEKIDITLPGNRPELGYQHPLRQTEQEICDILNKMGFKTMDGPEVEDDFHNFEALNLPADHPARDMQDTFYMPGGLVLRTHTSPVQIRTMLEHGAPVAVICPGKVFRVDSDVTHSPQFMQVEGLLVDEKTTFADLKGTLQHFVNEFFGAEYKTRFRPSFFPFTEPSAEVDISCVFCEGDGCRVCSNTNWLEVLGCGMVHKNVLKNCGIDPEKYQGFAFGIGIDRMCMLKYRINDIRLFYDNDQRFLSQFRQTQV
jgi:phenylalanyl-tRNA synthetase alpha chain